MIEIFEVDKNGHIIENYLHDEKLTLPEGSFVVERLPVGIHRPKWDFENKKWIDEITEEELREVRNRVKQPTQYDYLLNLDFRLSTLELGL